jgi:hypothetical protein
MVGYLSVVGSKMMGYLSVVGSKMMGLTHHFDSLKCVYQARKENSDVMYIAFLPVSTFHGVSSVDIKNNIRDPLFY